MIRWIAPLLVLCFIAPAFADDDDHDRARAAVQRGAILTLERILAIAEQDTPGRVIDVELGEDNDRYLYEIEIIDRAGRMVELKIDAASGRIIEREADD
jgi:uncharacterized membrane protein YkoI